MSINIKNLSVASIIENLVNEKLDVNELDISKIKDRDAFMGAVKRRPHILKDVKNANINHFLSYAIKENPDYFIYLNKEQYTDLLVQTFLYKRLENPNTYNDNNEKNCKLVIQKNLEEKIVFVCSYTTPLDAEIYYYDNELDVPSSLKYSFKVLLKLENSIVFINKMDTHLTQLGGVKIKEFLIDVIGTKFNAFVNNFVSKRKAGYYTLCASCEEIENEFNKELEKEFKAYGINEIQFKLRKFAIPKEILNKIEDLSFQLRQQRANIDANEELLKKSLENYERKLAIEAKYSNTTHSLTEYEKDLALKRYLIKQGRLGENAIDHSIQLEAINSNVDDVLEKKKDIKPEISSKNKGFVNSFWVHTIIWCTLSVLLGVFNIFVALGALGITISILVIVLACNIEKFLKPKTEFKSLDFDLDNKTNSNNAKTGNK